MKKILISILNSSVEINDFGPDLTEQFKIFFEEFLNTGKTNFSFSFIEESKKAFDAFGANEICELSDSYFENFTIVAENLLNPTRGRYGDALILWEGVIDLAKEWENKSGGTLHKGTPYYFSSVAAILSYNFDEAFILMHLAIEEDKRSHKNYKDDPAYLFLSLNNQKHNQYFRPFVDGMADFINRRLSSNVISYQKSRGGTLIYDDFLVKFLDNNVHSDEMRFYFVYSIIRLWHLRKLHKNKINDNIMAPAIFTQSLGGILIIIEQLIRNKYSQSSFGRAFSDMSKKIGWDANLDLKNINTARDLDFDSWVNACLLENSLFGDFKLTYGLRNFSFHKIESQRILWEKYTEVLQAILNSLFKAIEIQ